jgi:hypothetical protein
MLVGHTEIAVTQVVADRQLMFAEFSQHRSDVIPERMPGHADDPKFLERRSNLSFQDRREIESLLTAVESRRELRNFHAPGKSCHVVFFRIRNYFAHTIGSRL